MLNNKSVPPPKDPHDNYTLSILATALVAAGVDISLLALGDFENTPTSLLALWDIFHVLFFSSQLVSGAGYFFRTFDDITHKKTGKKLTVFDIGYSHKSKEISPKKKFDEAITFTGCSIGLLFSIAVTILQHKFCFDSALQMHSNSENFGLTSTFNILQNFSDFGGLGNRQGRFFQCIYDSKKNKINFFAHPRINYALGILIGTLIGLGIMTFFAVLASHLPLNIHDLFTLIFFSIATIGVGASAGGYIGRCFDFIRYSAKENRENKASHPIISGLYQLFFKRNFAHFTLNKQSILTIAFTAFSILLCVTLIAVTLAAPHITVPLLFLGISLPKIFLGLKSGAILAKAIHSLGLMRACLQIVSRVGGLGNRLGEAFDRKSPARFIKNDKAEKKDEPPVPAPNATISENPAPKNNGDSEAAPNLKEEEIKPSEENTEKIETNSKLSTNSNSLFNLKKTEKEEQPQNQDIKPASNKTTSTCGFFAFIRKAFKSHSPAIPTSAANVKKVAS